MTRYKNERTLVIIKPDGIQRSFIGEIIKRYEVIGLKLVALKILVPTPEQVEKHYTVDPDWPRKVGRKSIEGYLAKGLEPPSRNPLVVANFVLDRLKRYLTSGPVIVSLWQGAHAVAIVRKITGSTEPLTSDIGTIRGDYVLDSYQMSDEDDRAVRNLIHASASVEDALKEISLWFKKDEIINYRLIQEQILYDVNLDGIIE